MKKFTVSINNPEGSPVIYTGKPQKMILLITNSIESKVTIPEEIELFLPDCLDFSETENSKSDNSDWKFLLNEKKARFLFTGREKTDLAKGESCEIYLDNLMFDTVKPISENVVGIKIKIDADMYDVDLLLGLNPLDFIKIEIMQPAEIYTVNWYKNTLTLRILNMYKEAVRGRFAISFPYGNRVEDLTNADNAFLVKGEIKQKPCDLRLTKNSTGCWFLEFNDEDEYLEKGGIIVLDFLDIVGNKPGTSSIYVSVDNFEVNNSDVVCKKDAVMMFGVNKIQFEWEPSFRVKLAPKKEFQPLDNLTADLEWNIDKGSKIKIKFNEKNISTLGKGYIKIIEGKIKIQ